MTMPHLMNCGHSETGWCLDCVKAQWKELDDCKELIERIKNALGTEEDGIALVDIARNAHSDELENAAALKLVNDECPSMDGFINIKPTVAWLLQKWRECRRRWQDAVEVAESHHTMMNGPRIRQAFNLPATPTVGAADSSTTIKTDMKTPEQLHAEQSALPPMRTYYVVHERPKGSYIWTELYKTESAEAANAIAKKRVDDKERTPCDCIVTSHKLPRMPHPETEAPYAVLADGDTTYMGVAR